MKYPNKSHLILLQFLYISSLRGQEAEKIRVLSEVIGYVGHDVNLPCHLTTKTKDNITLVEWKLEKPGDETITIVVSHGSEKTFANNTSLKDRVNISEQSLIIRDLKMEDAGSYSCILATFPSGNLKGTTKLVVREKMMLSSGVISAIVISVVLLLVILTAVAYLIFIRRLGSFVRHSVIIDTEGPVRDVLRPSVLVREQDVVYADVKYKPSRVAEPSSNDKYAEAVHDDDVTYSQVVVPRRLPD
ncbi:uncharacterized protein LOC117822978 isoform X1 [Notolabrus celidotus]|uniref:uncharacterized protein LOC117822978 isoform X1 n=1 Tax=Notolabrus celidotus TaxID=1203425 RepID=UPI00148F5F22|nr:uncharacterized protein LOC117822978 isoform X1 [Notolabrus celidotus]